MASIRITIASALLLLGVVTCDFVTYNSEQLMDPNARLMFKIYDDCAKSSIGVSPCLKMRALTFIDRLTIKENIPITDDVSLVRNSAEGSRAITESEIEATLPTDAEERDSALTSLLMDRVGRFFSTYSMHAEVPEIKESDFINNNVEEGRGKKKLKKMMGMLMMIKMMKVGLILLLKVKALFFLAKKALIIAKIALIISLVGVVRKLMGGASGSSGHESSGWASSGVTSGASSSGWNRRSVENNVAHSLAFNAQRPS